MLGRTPGVPVAVRAHTFRSPKTSIRETSRPPRVWPCALVQKTMQLHVSAGQLDVRVCLFPVPSARAATSTLIRQVRTQAAARVEPFSLADPPKKTSLVSLQANAEEASLSPTAVSTVGVSENAAAARPRVRLEGCLCCESVWPGHTRCAGCRAVFMGLRAAPARGRVVEYPEAPHRPSRTN